MDGQTKSRPEPRPEPAPEPGPESSPESRTESAIESQTQLRNALRMVLTQEARQWLTESLEEVAADSRACAVRSAAAARRCGRDDLPGFAVRGSWSADEAARALLLCSVARTARAAVAADVYERGDPAERRAVLKALPLLALADADGMALIEDALRTNDGTLIAAALGPYAARLLPQQALRQAVLKCAFMSVPFAEIPHVLARADDVLISMLIDFTQERILAGRDVDTQILDVIAGRPGLLAASGIAAQADSTIPFRAAAAQRVNGYLSSLATDGDETK